MLPISALFLLVVVDFCIGLPSDAILSREDAGCENAVAGAHDPNCWAQLGYNDYFDTWAGSCPGPPGCTCDVRNPWSDCILNQYQAALGVPKTSGLSCTDLTRPDLCNISSGDWKKLSENQLAAAYVSTAIGNFYHFIQGWYMAITQSPTPAAVLESLFEEITNSSNATTNQTDIHVAEYLADLMTKYSTNNMFLQSFKKVIINVVGEDTVDVGITNIQTFQTALGQALGKTLNATLSTWTTPYFDSISKNGALLNISVLDKTPQLNNSLIQASPSQSFDITRDPGIPALNNTGRELLSYDIVQRRNYSIVECDASDIGGLADQIGHLLDVLQHNLFMVVHETAKGKRSQYGFSQLWHTQNWIPIQNVYKKLYNNDPIEKSVPNSRSRITNYPIFMCLQPHNRDVWAAHNVCVDEPRLRAFQDPERPNIIAICPSFWALPAAPPRAFCPYKGRFAASYIGSALQLNQQSILIHQLVRLYLGEENILDPEVFGLRQSMDLSADDAYKNPSTWAYWYSSVVGCTPQSWHDTEL